MSKLKAFFDGKEWLLALAAIVVVGGAVVTTRLVAAPSTELELPEVTASQSAQTEELSQLQQSLASEGDEVLTISGSETLDSLTYINGNKTLTGSGTLSMEAAGEYILVVQEGASLTLDGVTLDGTGNAVNGIYVSPGASFTMTSGAVQNVQGHGLRVLGTADLAGGTVSAVGTNWLILDEGASATVSGAVLSDAGSEGILTALGSQLTLSGATLSGTGTNLVYNCGTAAVTGGSYANAGGYYFYNEGTLTVTDTDLTGAEVLGYFENAETGTLTVSGGSWGDSKADFLYNKGAADLSNLTCGSSSATAIDNRGSSASLKLQDATFTTVGSLLVSRSAAAEVSNVTVESCGNHLIHNRGGEFTGSNLTVGSTGGVALYNDMTSDASGTCGNFTLDNFEIGSAGDYGVRTNGGVTTLSNGTVGVCASYGLYAKAGEVFTNKVTFLGCSAEGKGVVQIGLSTAPAGTVTMTETNITGGARGITNHGTLIFNSGSIYSNTNTGSATVGGAINNTGTCTIHDGTFMNNKSTSSGGAIYNTGSLTIEGGTISGNRSGKYGGGICNASEGTLVMTGGTIISNRAVNGGGGIESNGAMDLSGVTVSWNASNVSGGGIYVGSACTANISGSTIYGNATGSEKYGGGIYNLGHLSLTGCDVSGNKSGSYGGGIANSRSLDGSKVGVCSVYGGTFSRNYGGSGGGAVYNTGVMAAYSVTFKDNTVAEGKNGAAIYVSNEAGNLTLSGGTLNQNADGSPYDLYIYKGVVNLYADPEIGSIYRASSAKALNVKTNLTGSDINLYLKSYEAQKTEAINGTETLLKNNCGKFLLPQELRECGYYVDEQGFVNRVIPEEPVARIGTNTYMTLEEAFSAALGLKTAEIQLLSDVAISRIAIRTETTDYNEYHITLDLNGKTLTSTSTNGALLINKASTLEIFGGTITGSNGIIFANKGGVATISGGTYTGFNAAKVSGGNGTVSISGGTFSFDPTANLADGYKATDNKDGTWTVEKKTEEEKVYVASVGSQQFESLTAAVQAALEEGTATITLLKDISEDSRIEIRTGTSDYNEYHITLNLNGKTFASSSTTGAVLINKASTLNISGGTMTGSNGIVFANKGGVATISGGTYTGFNAAKASGGNGTVSVSGGTFSFDPTANLADGYKATDNKNGTWTVEKKAEEEKTYVAAIGTTQYESLSAAVSDALAAKTATIKLLADVSSERIEFRTGTKDYEAYHITLDLNGKKLTSSSTTGALLINKASTLNVYGGTIAGTDSIVFANKGGVATISGGTYTGFTAAKASGGGGTVSITGGTFSFDPTANLADGYLARKGTTTWTVEKGVTVTFDSQSGSAVDSQLVLSGAKVTEPAAPAKSGFTFGGWYEEASCENAWNFATEVVTEDKTLYAKWNKITVTTYNVTFDSNGGSTVNQQVIPENGHVEKPTDPIRLGYTFENWYKESTFNTVWNFDTETITEPTTIYAKWTAITDKEAAIFADGAYSYDTAGNALSSAANGSTVYLLKNVTMTKRQNVGSITVNLNGYTLTIDSGIDKPGAFAVKKNCTATLTGGTVVCNKTTNQYIAYTNTGATLNIVGGTYVNVTKSVGGNGSAKLSGGTFSYNPTEDSTAAVVEGYGVKDNGNNTWSVKQSLTVTFEAQNGSAAEQQTVLAGEKAAKPATDPFRLGYDFGGWYEDSACETAWDFDNNIVSAATTLYAKWTDKGMEAAIFANGAYSYDTADNALSSAANGSTVYLLKNVTMTTRQNVGSITVNLNGYTLTIGSGIDKAGAFAVKKNCTATLTGGTVVCNKTTNQYIAYTNTGATLNIVGGNYVNVTKSVGGNGSAKLSGGTFSYNPSEDSTAAVVDGYGVKDNGNNTYSVIEKVTVTFDSQEGSAVDSQTVLSGAFAAEPEAPAKEGFTFGGWYTNTEYTTPWTFATEAVTKDITLYAKWDAIA